MQPIEVTPIGTVRSPRCEVIDDVFGGVISQIDLDETRFTPDCLRGLSEFSHIEVLFYMDRVPESTIARGARHPRGREDWPSVGIFAQRAKHRPNRIGATICRLLSVDGLSISVESLDAIDGTPVIDIKPYMKEFAPHGDTRQPQWASELMSGYWTPHHSATEPSS